MSRFEYVIMKLRYAIMKNGYANEPVGGINLS